MVEVLINRTAKSTYPYPNEDAVGFRAFENRLVVWLIDGATSVDQNYRLSGNRLAGEWIAGELSQSLFRQSAAFEKPDELLQSALSELNGKFTNEAGTELWPTWARPMGAMSLAYIEQRDGAYYISSLHLADCAVYSVGPEVAVIHEKELRPETRMSSADLVSPIDQMKIGRAKIFNDPTIPILSLNPKCALYAIKRRSIFDSLQHLVIISDGISRYWDEYDLGDRDTTIKYLIQPNGFDDVIDKMRYFEGSDYIYRDNRLLKSSDDASILILKHSH
jgi:hypothetical protein